MIATTLLLLIALHSAALPPSAGAPATPLPGVAVEPPATPLPAVAVQPPATPWPGGETSDSPPEAGLTLVPAAPPLRDPPPDNIGGDDKLVLNDSTIASSHAYAMDIAENGDIYAALEVDDPVTGAEILVFRSQDGGDTWSLWGMRTDANPTRDFHQPSLHVAEGDEDRLYLAYQYENGAADRVINVVYSSLDLQTAAFTVQPAMSQAGVDFRYPSLSSDEMNFSAYRLYLAAEGDDGNGNDIWFARSTNFGAGWEAEYTIATLSAGDRDYQWPQVRYGVNGAVHCVWQFSIDGDPDTAIRYRRALNHAAAGLADWQPVVMLTSTTDGRRDELPSVAASHVSGRVLIAHMDTPGGISESQLRLSTDAGASWPAASTVNLEIGGYGPELLALPAGQGFQIAGYAGNGLKGGYAVSEAAPLSLSPERVFTDRMYYTDPVANPDVSLDYDASHGNRVAWGWLGSEDWYGDLSGLYFDAEWRSDPGYPNLEPGYPLELTAGAVAHPALVDLDGDSDLEIVFGDAAGRIQVYNPDGSIVPGWPVDIGDFPPTYPLPGGYPTANCAVAVGDLDGDDVPEVVAGGSDGRVHAYRRTGVPVPGWPIDLGPGLDVFVSIGRLQSGSRRQIVACAGEHVHVLQPGGAELPGFPVAAFTALTAPAAIGDLDANGETDLVVVGGDRLTWYDNAGHCHYQLVLAAGNSFCGQVSLGDLDLDGDLETAVPTANGGLRVSHHAGGAVFPIVYDPSQSYLTSAALANVIGTVEPDVSFAARQASVHLLLSNGSEAAGWPHDTGAGYFLLGAPIMETLDEGSGDVVIGSRDRHGYAWNNLFTNVPGWPRSVGDQCNVSPASGDIDGDGRVEVVFATSSLLVVLDTGAEIDRTDPRGQWPMYGYDPARTACLDCPEASSAVAAGPGPGPRTSLRLASPSPVGIPVRFRFELAEHVPVRLAMYDASGRLVREILRDEAGSGGHEAAWDGLDDQGRPAGSGVYFCRLHAGDRQLTARVVVMR